jgi:hypothetical protein
MGGYYVQAVVVVVWLAAGRGGVAIDVCLKRKGRWLLRVVAGMRRTSARHGAGCRSNDQRIEDGEGGWC